MRYMDLGSILTRSATNHGARPMLHWQDRTLTYQEVLTRASQFAAGLADREIERGQRVVLCLRNRPEYVISLFGCALAGVVAVPTNYRFSGTDIRFVIENSGARLAVVDDAVAPYDLISDEPDTCHWVVAGDFIPRDAGWTPFDIFSSATTAPAFPGALDDDLPGAIHYTSGSTSKPKGVVRSHGANAAMALGSLERLPMDRGDTWGLLLPMHSAGIYGVLLASVMAGNPVVLADYDPQTLGELIEKRRLTHLAMGPTMYYGAAPSLASSDVRCLRHAVWGGMPPNDRATRALETVLPVPILGAYGMTEATSVTYSTPEVYNSGRIASSGFPIASMAVRIVDPDGNPVGPRERGEILLQGAVGFTEYLDLPEKTAETLRKGWIHTGDGGWLDDDGALTVTGRLSGMIISGNENIWPEEVEGIIAAMPGIEQVAVVGVPSDKWGQEVCAYVVAEPTVTGPRVQDHCRKHLARYKVPKRVFVVDDLPKDAQGKVQKSILAQNTRQV